MYEVWIKNNQRDDARRWAMFNCVGYWEETEVAKIVNGIWYVAFSFDIEGDALRADLTYNGDSLLLIQDQKEHIPELEQQEVKMSVLSKLRFADIELKAAPTTKDPVERSREKLIESINEMKMHVDHAIKGEVYVPVKSKYVKVDGANVKEEKEIRIREWYRKHDGKYYTLIRYGTRILELVPGKKTVECGSKLEDVKKVYDMVIEATKAGELDEQLKEAAKRIRKAE